MSSRGGFPKRAITNAGQVRVVVEEGGGGGSIDAVKSELLCADDLSKEFTWQEIDGVRRVVEIVFSSALYDAAHTPNTTTLVRTFTYGNADPFDLLSVVDEVVITPP